MASYIVYILRTTGNTLYTGQTSNLERRLEQHRRHKVGAKYLRMFPSFDLVYKEKVLTLSEALRREREIKKMTKLKKESLIKLADDHN